MGRGTDLEWLTRLSQSKECKGSAHFHVPKIQSASFVVRHFAADVHYRVEGFLEKNKDPCNLQLLQLLTTESQVRIKII